MTLRSSLAAGSCSIQLSIHNIVYMYSKRRQEISFAVPEMKFPSYAFPKGFFFLSVISNIFHFF